MTNKLVKISGTLAGLAVLHARRDCVGGHWAATGQPLGAGAARARLGVRQPPDLLDVAPRPVRQQQQRPAGHVAQAGNGQRNRHPGQPRRLRAAAAHLLQPGRRGRDQSWALFLACFWNWGQAGRRRGPSPTAGRHGRAHSWAPVSPCPKPQAEQGAGQGAAAAGPWAALRWCMRGQPGSGGRPSARAVHNEARGMGS